MGRTVAIVQARLGSTRLPLKSLINLRGLPIIDWVTTRLAQSFRLDDIVVAIPDTMLDKALGRHLQAQGIRCMEGSENDVLGRFALAARSTHADTVVRVCADNPLVSGPAIDALVDFFANNDCDYAWNHIPRDNLWPDGLGAEIVSAELLYKLDSLAKLPGQREHCFNYIWDNAEKFRMATFDPGEKSLQRPDIKLDIDSVADYSRLANLEIEPGMNDLAIIAAWDEANT